MLTLSEHRDPLALTICPRCDYDLHGLPPEGICPECGRPYDRETIFLRGWDAETKQSPWGLVWMFSGNFAILVADRVGVAVAVAIVVGVCTATVLAYRYSPPLTRVKMNSIGCTQYQGRGTSPLWTLNSRTAFFVLAPFLCFLAIYLLSRQNIGPEFFLISAAASAIVLIAALISRSQRKRNVRLATQMRGEFFDEYESPSKVTLWADAQYLEIVPTRRKGRMHLRIASAPNGWKQTPVVYVDAKVMCSDEQAKELRQRVEGWQKTWREAARPANASVLKL